MTAMNINIFNITLFVTIIVCFGGENLKQAPSRLSEGGQQKLKELESSLAARIHGQVRVS